MEHKFWPEDLGCNDCKFDIEENEICMEDIKKPKEGFCDHFDLKEPSDWRKEEKRYRGEK